MKNCPVCEKKTNVMDLSNHVISLSEGLQVHYDCFFNPLPKFKELASYEEGYKEQQAKRSQVIRERQEELIRVYS